MIITALAPRWLLTAVFAAAGLRAVLPRREPARSAQPADRVSAVFCGAMCAALIAMTWRSEPAAATWLQAALFGCAALWFGLASLAGLFDGRRQLITYHFMWRHAQSGFPGADQGCPTCSFLADSIGHLSHLHACDTTLVLVSRAPIASIERFEKRMGWQVPWYSSAGSDFNYDFHVSFDEGKAPLEYNYKDKETLERVAPYIRSGADGPGVSVFVREGDRVFHTYSAYERGLDSLLGTYRWLDLTPLGRQRHVTEFPYHDTYDQES